MAPVRSARYAYLQTLLQLAARLGVTYGRLIQLKP